MVWYPLLQNITELYCPHLVTVLSGWSHTNLGNCVQTSQDLAHRFVNPGISCIHCQHLYDFAICCDVCVPYEIQAATGRSISSCWKVMKTCARMSAWCSCLGLSTPSCSATQRHSDATSRMSELFPVYSVVIIGSVHKFSRIISGIWAVTASCQDGTPRNLDSSNQKN